MAEHSRPVVRGLSDKWATVAQDDTMVLGDSASLGVLPNDMAPLPGREPIAPSVGGILQGLLAGSLAEAAPSEPPSIELMTDIARIEARIRSLAAQEAQAIVRTAGGIVRGRLVAALSDGSFPLQLASGSPIPDAPFELELQGYNSVYRFGVKRLLRMGDRVAVPLPACLERLQHRKSRRADAPANLVISFPHPVFAELQVRRAVRDVSRHGVSFETRVDQDILCAGLRLHDVVLTTQHGATLHFDGEVRIVHPPRDGRGAACGVRLTPRSVPDATRWGQLVGTALNPHTRLGATWSEDTWELYTASGYFSLSGKSQAHFGTLKGPFASVTRKVDSAPQVGCQVVWPSERGVEASLSLLKVYEHTWFGFQMAKLKGAPPDGASGRQVLRDIHLRAYEHAQADPELRWTTALVQATAQWSKLVHYDLPHRYLHSGLSAVVDFHALEIDVPARPPRSPDENVGFATLHEREALLEALVPRRPLVYREALDLVPERFGLEKLRGEWSAAGLTRERDLLVARRGGRMIAAATVESADPGLHLFNLLDLVRLYAISVDGASAFPALLDAASAWYRARGRASFTCLLEEESTDCAVKFSPRDLGAGALTVLSTELLPSFLEHVTEVTAPRLTRD